MTRHFSDSDLDTIASLADKKLVELESKEDFEIYVLLKSIPKLIADLRDCCPHRTEFMFVRTGS